MPDDKNYWEDWGKRYEGNNSSPDAYSSSPSQISLPSARESQRNGDIPEIIGNYRIIRQLGKGGYSKVYLGEHVYLGTEAAIKVLALHLDKEDAENFLREARLIAHLRHPNIVQVLDFGLHHSIPFLVMSYAPHGAVSDKYESGTKLPLDTVVPLIRQVAAGLEYAHERRVIHLDVKPKNMLLGPQDEVLLSDFGIAVVTQTHGIKRETIAGTVSYMAPEQLQGSPQKASDQYALGVVTYLWLCGELPFRGNPQAVVWQHVSAPAPALRTKEPSIPLDVEKVVLKALAKNPTDRFPSVKAFADALELASARHLAPARRKRLMWRFALVGLVALLLIGIGLPLLFHYGIIHGDYCTSLSVVPSLPTSANHGVDVTMSSDGDYIGLSDGSFIFDTKRFDGILKCHAAYQYQLGDQGGAGTLLSSAAQRDIGDAEALIYQEDQHVVSSGHPYFTLVVVTDISAQTSTMLGRDILQGAYVAQREYNAAEGIHGGGKLVRLLIANTGGGATVNAQSVNAALVAQQIVQAANIDKSIIGVVGWPTSVGSISAITQLQAARIPILSSNSSSDALTGKSPYFFRIVPPDSVQGRLAALFAENTLGVQSAAVLYDPANAYSQSLKDGFVQQFATQDNHIITTSVPYSDASTGSIADAVPRVLNTHPDLIYFAGYSSSFNVLLAHIHLADNGPMIMGGDSLTNLSKDVMKKYAQQIGGHLYYTAFADPEEWHYQNLTQPEFFREYAEAFDPRGMVAASNPNGYARVDSNTMLSYDAVKTMLAGYLLAQHDGKSQVLPDDLRQALTTINGDNTILGASGQISVGTDNNPIDKAVAVLQVTMDGAIQIQALQGRFQLPTI